MPAITEPNSGLKYGWDYGELNWDTEMNANMLSLGRVLGQCSVIDRDLTAPPGSPANGDRYIVSSVATGAWASKENSVAVYDSDIVAWTFYVPFEGWLTYIEDEQKLSVYKVATGWSTGLAI